MRSVGSITGEVFGCNGPYSGLTVYLPGTSFQSRVGIDGRFEMPFVIPGTYSLVIEQGGSFLRSLPSVSVRKGKSVDVGRQTICPGG